MPGIRDRYLKMRINHSFKISFLYLLWLNIRYYILFDKRLRAPLSDEFYKPLKLKDRPESALYPKCPPEQLAQKLKKYDVICFDIFDTLILRPFLSPDHLFYIVSLKLNYPAFRELRINAEKNTRAIKKEPCFNQIWQNLSHNTGIDFKSGSLLEWQCERKLCFANPYMIKVVCCLLKLNKTVVAISDMYFKEDYLKELLIKNGYGGIKNVLSSCDYGTSKSEGGLYRIVKDRFYGQKSFAMVGDNLHSDIKMAQKNGFDSYYYPNVNQLGAKLRCKDMSKLVKSVYGALVNAHIYNGVNSFDIAYEYGFIYGGLFVLGYTRFIRRIKEQENIEKLLFLSRDGALLLKAYRQCYPDDRDVCYAYWSRLCAIKLCADHFRDEFFLRFVYHKALSGITFKELFLNMELIELLDHFAKSTNQNPGSKLTYKNADSVKKYLQDSWPRVLEIYSAQQKAAAKYYGGILKGAGKAAAVDIGWAGSGAVMLCWAVNNIFDIKCDITGLLAACGSANDLKADLSFPLLQSGKLKSYMFSQSINRDLYKYHNPALLHNLYWELLLGAPQPGFKGFYTDKGGNVKLEFKQKGPNKQVINQIHLGAMEFVKQFTKIEKDLGFEIDISGRDAYAPLINFLAPKNHKLRDKLKEALDNADMF